MNPLHGRPHGEGTVVGDTFTSRWLPSEGARSLLRTTQKQSGEAERDRTTTRADFSRFWAPSVQILAPRQRREANFRPLEGAPGTGF